ncbi:Gfo/Idh/MocA family protein [Virgisporangium aurantiacum]|uniref:Inositol 2-dehydrogenase n=1 Tax=Virgisporangium aurantiacum TaxID=175570 RepID=A0A8J3ZBD7_9ACTN|nr:Gfo/Idh/MocA family oxidoreductase [Virgisporangium aurantiacum]GIJ60856.1 inositol 2-dehydrogenase [Virgisporangium aurantiacum]
MRVVLVGFGGIGIQDHQTDMYLPAFAKHPAFTLVGVADAGGTEKAAKTAGEHGLRHFTSLQEAFDATDVVCVAAPIDVRGTVVADAVRAGKHVLADKPLAATLAEAREIERLAADNDVVVVPAHHIRLGGALRSTRAAVRAGKVGLPWNVQADFLVAGGDPSPIGELANLALYPVDAVCSILGLDVTRVWATGGDTLVTLMLDHPNGVTSTVVCGRTATVHGIAPAGLATHRYRISGSHGVLTVDATRPALRVRTGGTQATAWTGSGTVDALLGVLAAGIRTGRPEIGVADAVRVHRIIEAARRSIDTGAPVDVEGDS